MQIINCVKQYRRVKKVNCSGLLAMLWNYTDHDEVMMQMEEENRAIYEPHEVILKRRQKEIENKEKKNFRRKTQILLNEIQSRRSSIIETKESIDMEKKKERR